MSDEKDKGREREQSPGAEDETTALDEDEFFFQPSEKGQDGESGLLETDDRQAAEIREIFGTAFPQYLQPVEEIVEQLLAGRADAESFEALLGMLSSLMSASSRMGFENVLQTLSQLNQRVSGLDPQSTEPVSREQREAILGDLLEHKDMAEQMQGEDRIEQTERQKTIFSALRGKQGIGDLVLRRLSAAGLITVDQLRMGRPEEIAAVTGLDISIVHNVLDALKQDETLQARSPSSAPGKKGSGRSGDVGARSTDRVSTPSGEDKETDIPVQLESLHDQVLQQLRSEVEAEAAVEQLKAVVRKLQSRVSESRVQLLSLQGGMTKKKQSLGALSDRLAQSAAILEDLRARRDTLARQCASSDEALRQKELRLEVLKKERRNLDTRSIDLSRQVSGLVDTLGQIRRSVAKGRTTE